MGFVTCSAPSFSPREREVITWAARGKADVDTAIPIGCGPETVRSYLKSAMRKLHVVARGQLIEAALRAGVIDFSVDISPFE